MWYSLRSYTQSGRGGAWRCVSLGSVYVAARVGAVCLLACVIACGLCEVPGGGQLRLALVCGWSVVSRREQNRTPQNTVPFIQGPAHRTPRNLLHYHSSIHPFKILRQNGIQIYIRQLRKMTKLDGPASSPFSCHHRLLHEGLPSA